MTPHHVCRICGQTGIFATYSAREMMFGLGDAFRYIKCSHCGCLQIAVIPPDLSEFYPSNYYSLSKKPKHSPIKQILNMTLLASWPMRQLAALALGLAGRTDYASHFRALKQAGLTKDSRLLEVGCGTGRLLFGLWELNYRDIIGCEPYLESDVEYPNGLYIQKSPLDKITGMFDIILFDHVFEHLPDPLDTLLTCYRLLADGGRLILRVPTVSSLAWRRYGINWVQLDAPRHLYLYSRPSLCLLAGKSGFYIYNQYDDSTDFQFWGSESYCQSKPLAESSAKQYPLAKRIDWRRRAANLNRRQDGDQLTLILKKNSRPSLDVANFDSYGERTLSPIDKP